MNANHQKPKKKYSGALFLENDEFDCFVDDFGNKIQKPAGNSQGQEQMSQEQQQGQGQAEAQQQAQGMMLTNQMNPYNSYMYNNAYQNPMFPMVQVPMNMPMLNMMNFGNMFYNMSNEQNSYDNNFNQFMTLPVEQVVEQFEEKILDQKGCKQLQARIENDGSNSKLFKAIFDLVLKKFRLYSENQFANYFCQKIIELCTRGQLKLIVESVVSEAIEISQSNHGTRVIQKIIENLEDEQLVESLLNQFRGNVVELVLDVNGNHVLQKCLSYFSAEKVSFMYQEIMMKVEEVATHKYGCCVLQRCIDYCSDEQIDEVIGGILKITTKLLNDKYGNYVIQYILELQGYENYKAAIGESINLNIIFYCYQKYSSNVVEKCLKVDVKTVFEKLVDILQDVEELKKMISDQFGNYVVQTAMLRNRHSPKIKPTLKEIKKHGAVIKESQIGAKVMIKLGRVFDFWAQGEEVPLKDNQDYNKRRFKKGYKKNYSGYQKKNYGYSKKGKGQGNHNNRQGYVNMNMNLNFNVNLNYQNQGNANAANGAGNGNGGNNSWE